MVDVFECSLVCIMPVRGGHLRGDLGECCDFFGDGFLLIGLFLQLPRGHPLVLSLAQRAPSSLTLRGLRANLWFTPDSFHSFPSAGLRSISVLLALRQSPFASLRANLWFTIFALSCFVCHLFSNIASACLWMLFLSFAGPRTLACEPQLRIQRSISNRSASSIRNSIRPSSSDLISCAGCQSFS